MIISSLEEAKSVAKLDGEGALPDFPSPGSATVSETFTYRL